LHLDVRGGGKENGKSFPNPWIAGKGKKREKERREPSKKRSVVLASPGDDDWSTEGRGKDFRVIAQSGGELIIGRKKGRTG